MKQDGRDLLARFRALAPPQPSRSRSSGGARAGSGLAVLVAALLLFSIQASAGLLTPAHDLGVDGTPTCGTDNLMILMAQSVPSARLVPCVASLPAGWDLGGVQIDDERGTLLARLRRRRRPRGRGDAAAAEPAARVDGATRGAERRGRDAPLRAGGGSCRRTCGAPATYLFHGGCVIYEFEFDGALTGRSSSTPTARSPSSLVEPSWPRSASTADLALCGAGAPVPRRFVMLLAVLAASVSSAPGRGRARRGRSSRPRRRCGCSASGAGGAPRSSPAAIGWATAVSLASATRRLGLGRRRVPDARDRDRHPGHDGGRGHARPPRTTGLARDRRARRARRRAPTGPRDADADRGAPAVPRARAPGAPARASGRSSPPPAGPSASSRTPSGCGSGACSRRRAASTSSSVRSPPRASTSSRPRSATSWRRCRTGSRRSRSRSSGRCWKPSWAAPSTRSSPSSTGSRWRPRRSVRRTGPGCAPVKRSS